MESLLRMLTGKPSHVTSQSTQHLAHEPALIYRTRQQAAPDLSEISARSTRKSVEAASSIVLDLMDSKSELGVKLGPPPPDLSLSGALFPPSSVSQLDPLATLRRHEPVKDETVQNALRSDAHKVRMALFAAEVKALREKMVEESPGEWGSLCFMYDSQAQNYRIVYTGRRLDYLRQFSEAADKNQDEYGKEAAKHFAFYIIDECEHVLLKAKITEQEDIEKIRIFIDYMQTFVDRINCAEDIKLDIQETWSSMIRHQTWRLCVAAKEAGKARNLDKLLSLYNR